MYQKRYIKTTAAKSISPLPWCAPIACLVCAILAARAQSPAKFYPGKTIDLAVGYSAGGGYDVYARLLARHLGRHIPGNPMIVPKNMPGAGSLVLGNWL